MNLEGTEIKSIEIQQSEKPVNREAKALRREKMHFIRPRYIQVRKEVELRQQLVKRMNTSVLILNPCDPDREGIFKSADFKKLGSSFKGFRAVGKLRLWFHETPRYQSILRHLENNLKGLSGLKEISLAFPSWPITNKNSKYTFQGVKSMKSLKHLYFYFRKDSEIINKEIQHFTKHMSRLRNLESFDIRLGYCEYITEKSILYLLESSKKFHKFHSLCLHLTLLTLSFTNQAWMKINQCFRTLKLKGIDLDFYRWPGVTEEGWKELSNTLALLKPLQSLKLSITEHQHLNSETMSILSQSFEKLSSLKDFQLDLVSCYNVNDLCLTSLSKSLSRLSALTKISLTLSGCQCLPNIGLKTLKEALNKQHSLKDLTVNFSCLYTIKLVREGDISFYLIFGVSDEGFCSIIEGLEREHNILQNLAISFTDSMVTDKGLEFLGEKLQKILSLKTLYLDLSSCHEITKGQLKRFGKNLKKLTNLKSIELRFKQCKKIDQEDLNCLRKELENYLPCTSIKISRWDYWDYELLEYP